METVENILADMNATNWRFNGENCMLDMISQVPKPTEEANATITCECNIGNDTNCHVVSLYKVLSFFDIHLLLFLLLFCNKFLNNKLNNTPICLCSIHKWYSLDGILSPELAKLPYLRSL